MVIIAKSIGKPDFARSRTSIKVPTTDTEFSSKSHINLDMDTGSNTNRDNLQIGQYSNLVSHELIGGRENTLLTVTAGNRCQVCLGLVPGAERVYPN